MSWSSPPLSLALAGILAGCTPEASVSSDYSLSLQPRVPSNQQGLFDDQSISLVFRQDGEFTVDWIDDLTGDQVSRADFGPLDGAQIGVLVEAPGGQATQIDPDLLVAYGEVGPFTLATGEETVEAPFLLAAYGGVGDIDVLPEDEGALRAGAVMTPDGTTWLFGGSRQIYNTDQGHSFVQKLEPLDDGDWVFDVVAEMPDFDGSGQPDAAVGTTATYVEASGRPYILVTGGRPKNVPYTDNSKHAALWDPVGEEWVWDDENGMVGSRAQHQAMRMQNGNVLIVGGMTGGGLLPGPATAEIFDVDQKQFDIVGTLDMPSVGFALADLGPKGVLICGGGFGENEPEQHTRPSDACQIVTPTGDIEETESLPFPVQGLAMAALGDGRVLACGGLPELANFQEPVDAITDAWIYDPASQTWTELTSRMNTARALHQAVPMPDGRILIVGGAERAALLDGIIEEPVACNEVFEPDTFTFTLMEPCGSAGGGAEPTVAWHPDHGAVIVEGYDDESTGGVAFGVVGFPPNL